MTIGDVVRELMPLVQQLGLVSLRGGVLFICLPLLGTEAVPPTIRVSLTLVMAAICLAVLPRPALPDSALRWAAVLFHEAFIGGVIGLMFGSVFWAFQSAGEIIDSKAGTSSAQVGDPLTGQQTSLNGALLGRIASYVFLLSGGLSGLLALLIKSYVVWPIGAPFNLRAAGSVLFTDAFGVSMAAALMISAPTLVFLFLLEAGLGLANRAAQQLNVFQLSMALKAWATTLIILMSLGALIARALGDHAVLSAATMATLRQVLR